MKDKCKKYSKDLGCCMMLSDFSQPMPVLQPCIESPCKHYKPYTNFSKITESVESLVDAFEQNMGRFDSRKEFIEWLQQEVADETL